MRRRSFYCLIAFSFVAWVAFTCFIFHLRPQVKAQKNIQIQRNLEQLEQELQDQSRISQELFQDIRKLEKKIHSINSNFTETDKQHEGPVIGVLVFACNRVSVKRNIDQLLRYRPAAGKHFPIVVSQDCGHLPTTQAIRSYGDQLTLIQHPDLSDIPLVGKEKKFKGYYKIARHYGWALNYTFHTLNFDTIIIVEDDLDIAPDFFDYFQALYPILKSDPTLWCVSAWNDNGKDGLVTNDPELLYRSDFFPGLGWMLTKDLWLELQSKWPRAFWDDWIRQPAQRKDRACIRPEISRTKTFGKVGVSNGLFFEKHLKFIKLNDKPVPFLEKDLSYLKKDNYDVAFVKQVYGSPSVTLQQLQKNNIGHDGPVRITYHTKDDFKKTAKALGLMDDFKSGVPRTGYRGVVNLFYKGRRVFLAPPADWSGYNTSWT